MKPLEASVLYVRRIAPDAILGLDALERRPDIGFDTAVKLQNETTSLRFTPWFVSADRTTIVMQDAPQGRMTQALVLQFDTATATVIAAHLLRSGVADGWMMGADHSNNRLSFILRLVDSYN